MKSFIVRGIYTKNNREINKSKVKNLSMATIKYQCDTCKRTTEILENYKGLEVFTSCVITKGCRGKLYKISRNPYNFREAFDEPDSSGNLENFEPRKIFFKYKQDILSDKWIIKHGLNTNPVVKIFIEGEDGKNISPFNSDGFSVNYKSSNELEVLFNKSFTGQAHLISRSISEETIDSIPSAETLIPVSYNNTLAFAVISKYLNTQEIFPIVYTTGVIQLDIVLEEPNQEPIFCTETLTGLETGASPWNDFRSILFRRRRNFNIKTKNIADFRVIKDRYNSLKEIPQLTKLTIKKINFYPPGSGQFQDIKSKQLLILLAKPPYDKADKNLDQVIDVGEINQQNKSFFFIDGILYSEPDNIEKVYPKIEKDDVIVPPPTLSATPTPSATPTLSVTPTPSATPTPTPTPTLSSASLVWVDTTADWSTDDEGLNGNVTFNGTCFQINQFYSANSDSIFYGGTVSPVYGVRFELTLMGSASTSQINISLTTDAGSKTDSITITNGVPFLYELDQNSGVFDGVSGMGSAELNIDPDFDYSYDTVVLCNIEVLTNGP